MAKSNNKHGILGGSAEILDRNLAIAAGFGVVCLKLRRPFNRVNLYVFGSRLDFPSVFLVEIS